MLDESPPLLFNYLYIFMKKELKAKNKYKTQKAKDKLELKLSKKKESVKRQYDKLRTTAIAKVSESYDKKLVKRLRHEEIQYEKRRIIEKKKIMGKKTSKDIRTPAKRKQKALKEIQKYSKLSRAVYSTEWPKVFLTDKLVWVKLTSTVNGWHVYSQKNYPQLAFDERNIRPISSQENRRQGDTTAERKVNIPREDREYIEERSKDKSMKRKTYTHNDYVTIYEKYKAKNLAECSRLGIEYK